MFAARFVTRFTVFGIFLAFSSLAVAQTTYRWIDRTTGQTVYSDHPPPAGVRYTTQGGALRESGEGDPPSADGPTAAPTSPSYTVRQTAARYPVVLYTAAHCADPCQQARALLNVRGVPFTERTLGEAKAIEEFAKRFGDTAGIPAASRYSNFSASTGPVSTITVFVPIAPVSRYATSPCPGAVIERNRVN